MPLVRNSIQMPAKRHHAVAPNVCSFRCHLSKLESACSEFRSIPTALGVMNAHLMHAHQGITSHRRYMLDKIVVFFLKAKFTTPPCGGIVKRRNRETVVKLLKTHLLTGLKKMNHSQDREEGVIILTPGASQTFNTLENGGIQTHVENPTIRRVGT